MFNVRVEWHLKGTCIWIASVLGIVANIILIVQKLRHPKKYTYVALSTVVIALSGIGMIAMEQTTFLNENIHPIYSPAWLVSIRGFTVSYYGFFLRPFFRYLIDFAVVCHLVNLYILICRPQFKVTMLSKKVVALVIACNLGVSAVFASLFTKLQYELVENPGFAVFGTSTKSKSVWISMVVLTSSLTILTCSSCIFFTYKIKANLERAINFLTEANVTGPAAQAYRRIIRFSIAICVIIVVYRLFFETIMIGCQIVREIINSGLIGDQPLHIMVILINGTNALKYLNNVIVCFKPFCYGMTFVMFS